MSQTKFTKGPWVKDKRNESLVGSNGKCILIYNCGLSTGGGKEDEYVANSNLIAAAPDMYKMIDELCGELQSLDDDYFHEKGIGNQPEVKVINKAQLLLKKARGEQCHQLN